MTNALTDDAVLSEDQKSDIIEAWSETWRGSTKLGFTSHMLLSFPTDVTVDQVRDIAMDWTEHFSRAVSTVISGITFSPYMTTAPTNMRTSF